MASIPRRSVAPWLAGAFLLLLALHLALAFRIPGPILYEDTPGYLAIARALAGWEPPPVVNAPDGFYHAGYPLLLAPLYRLLGSTQRVFEAARVLDSILASLQLLVLYSLARGMFGMERGFALAASAAAALYPASMLQSSFVWSESLFALLFSLWVLLAWQALRRGGAWVAAFAVAGALLYAVHPRGLGLVAVTLAFLGLWAIRGHTGRGWTAAGLAAAVALFAATRALQAWYFERLWLARPRSHEGAVLARLLDPEVWTGPLAARAAGQVWYLLAATLGLCGVGALFLLDRALSRATRPEDGARARVAALILLAGAAVLFTSATGMLPAERSDHLVYGRYNEALLGPFLLAGLTGLAGIAAARRVWLARLAASAGLLALLGAVLPRVLPADLLAKAPMPLNVLGILLWNPWATLDLGRTTGFALGALALFALPALFSRRAGVALLAVYFAGSAVLVAGKMLPWTRAVRAAVTLQDEIRPLSPVSLSYERAGLSTYGFNGYQLWLDRVPFRLFDASAGETPSDPLVIATRSWGAQAAGFRMVAAEPRGMDQALWVAPGRLQRDLERRGRLVPADPAAPLLPEACRSRIARLDGKGPVRMRSGADSFLTFRVEHAGQGAAWIPLGFLESPRGSVRLGAQWLQWLPSGEARPVADAFPLRGELPRRLLPGEAAEVELAVHADRAGGTPLPPGSYVLEVSLVQEGIQWFPWTGDAALRIPFELR